MAAAKKGASLGFDLNELSRETARYDAAVTPAPGELRPHGRPKISEAGSVQMTVRVTPDQRKWILRQAAQQQLDTGERRDASMLIREMIDQARARAA